MMIHKKEMIPTSDCEISHIVPSFNLRAIDDDDLRTIDTRLMWTKWRNLIVRD